MRIALIVPPFIAVPPRLYGGTELFVAHLAEGLDRLGHEAVVYSNGESTIGVENRWLYERGQWPLNSEIYGSLNDINHTAWAVEDAASTCDIIHVNNAPGVANSRFVRTPFVYTIHHEHIQELTDYYSWYPDTFFVTISDFQRRKEPLPRIRTIHHGIDFSKYRMVSEKQPYVCFLGRIAPIKGPHLAIAAAKRAGIPLKIAGEIQPMFRDYWEQQVRPHVDGVNVEYVGEVGLAAKNELLGNSLGMLFPIQWEEPFGLVMIEAMVCGTPVLALPGGSVPEVVSNGVSGYVCSTTEEMAAKIRELANFKPSLVRAYAEESFSLERMTQQYATLYLEAVGGQSGWLSEDLDEERPAVA
ncbi:MAG: glycosyltransferase family 4 protein [Candidatus Korobacteraceae bacterium]